MEGCGGVEGGVRLSCSAARSCAAFNRHCLHVGWSRSWMPPQPPRQCTCGKKRGHKRNQTHSTRESSPQRVRTGPALGGIWMLTLPSSCERLAACGSACAAGGAAAAAAAARVLGRCGAAEADAPASMCSVVWVAGMGDGWLPLCSCAPLPAAALDPHAAACGRGPLQSSAAGVSDSYRVACRQHLNTLPWLSHSIHHARAAVCGRREWRPAHSPGQQQWEISRRKTAFLTRMHAIRMTLSN